VNLIR